MNKPSISDVLTKVDTLHEAVLSLTGTVTTLSGRVDSLSGRVDSLSGRVDSLSGRVDSLSDVVTNGFRDVGTRFDNVERTLGQHSAALLELSTVTVEHTAMHREHRAALERIERRQRGETRTLDEHERRIRALERRGPPSSHSR